DVVIASETMTGLSHEDLMQLSKPAVFIGSERRAGIWGEAAKSVAADDTEALVREINHLLDDPAGRGSSAGREEAGHRRQQRCRDLRNAARPVRRGRCGLGFVIPTLIESNPVVNR